MNVHVTIVIEARKEITRWGLGNVLTSVNQLFALILEIEVRDLVNGGRVALWRQFV
jgi:hypothetical protein